MNSLENNRLRGRTRKESKEEGPVGKRSKAVAVRGREEVQGALERLEGELLERLRLHGVLHLRAASTWCRHDADPSSSRRWRSAKP